MEDRQFRQVVSELVGAQLLVEVLGDQLAFRHALIRDAAYGSLLRRERLALHDRIAQTLERVYDDAPDAHTAELAFHYFEAGAWEQALAYARRAGERSLALHAPREAVEHLSRALDAARRLSGSPSPHLYRLRASAYETVGDFEPARVDYETALRLAEDVRDDREACEALLSLGLLWAARDYQQTGQYLQRALALARVVGDPALLGRSLNRYGNWHANVEQPEDALRLHREALGIFETLQELPSIAHTLDLLGLASQMMCDVAGTTEYYGRAVELFRRLDDKRGLSSSLAVMTTLRATYHSFSLGSIDALPEGTRPVMAIDFARQIGWRAGEAFGLLALGFYLGARGQYAAALKAANEALLIAEQIGHKQWTAAAYYALGLIGIDLFDLASAVRHLERALLLATEMRSLHWPRLVAAHLAIAHIRQNDFPVAVGILDNYLTLDTPMQTQGQRTCWCVRGELALAQGDPGQALQIAERLIASAPNPVSATEQAIPRIWRLRADALMALGRHEQAAPTLGTLREVALRDGVSSLLWRIDLALGRLYHATQRPDAAREAFARARGLVEALALEVPGEGPRDLFARHALALIAQHDTPSGTGSA